MICLLVGIVYLLDFFWKILKKEIFNVIQMFFFGLITLLVICCFTYILLFSVENFWFFFSIVLLALVGLLFLNYRNK